MQRPTFFIFLFVFLLYCSPKRNFHKIYSLPSCSQDFYIVDLKNLRDSFSFYNNKMVQVPGTFHWGTETTFITDKTNRQGQNIGIEFVPKLMLESDSSINFVTSVEEHNKTQEKNVILRGIVDTSIHGHLAQNIFTIKKVCFLQVLD